MNNINYDNRFEEKDISLLERELKDRDQAFQLLNSDLAKSDEALRDVLEKGIFLREETISFIINSPTFKNVLNEVLHAQVDKQGPEIEKFIAAKTVILGLLNEDEKQIIENALNSRIESLKAEITIGGIAGAALKAVGIKKANNTLEPIPSGVNFEEETLLDDLESSEVLIRLTGTAIRINDGQIITFRGKNSPKQNTIDYSLARRRVLERLVMCEDGEELSFNGLKDYLGQFSDIPAESIDSANFVNIRSWLEKITVDDNPVFVHNKKRAGASRYSVNPLFRVTLYTEAIKPEIAKQEIPNEENNLELNEICEIDLLMPREKSVAIHGAIGRLIRMNVLDLDFPTYPYEQIDTMISSEIENGIYKVRLLSEKQLRELRAEALEELVALIETDNLLRVIEIVDSTDSRYLLVDYLAQLSSEQHDILKKLFNAQLISHTTYGKSTSASLEIVGTSTELLNEDGTSIQVHATGTADGNNNLFETYDLLDDTQEDEIEYQPTEDIESEVMVEIPEESVILKQNNIEVDNLAVEVNLEKKRSTSQESFYIAGMAYLDTQVITKIVENNLKEGMNRSALEVYFPFMSIRKFVSARENGLVKSFKDDGLTYEDIFMLALSGNKQLKSKMDVKSFKNVLEELKQYFLSALNAK